jgi:hypothetical protein
MLPLTWADFLLGQGSIDGYPYSNIYETYAGFGNFLRDWRYKDADGFVQDDFRVAKRLTVNLGLRWEHIGDLGSANGGGNVDVSKINPNPSAAGSLAGYQVNSNYKGPTLPTGVIQGKNTFGFNGDGQNTWNPRLGFSWMVPGTDRFVLRGGVGVYHSTTEGQMNLLLCAEAPTGIWAIYTGTYNGASSDANPFPYTPTFPVFAPYSPSTDFTLSALGMGWRPPTIYHYLRRRVRRGTRPAHDPGQDDQPGASGVCLKPDSRPDHKYPCEHCPTPTLSRVDYERNVLLQYRWRGLVQLFASLTVAEVQT